MLLNCFACGWCCICVWNWSDWSVMMGWIINIMSLPWVYMIPVSPNLISDWIMNKAVVLSWHKLKDKCDKGYQHAWCEEVYNISSHHGSKISKNTFTSCNYNQKINQKNSIESNWYGREDKCSFTEGNACTPIFLWWKNDECSICSLGRDQHSIHKKRNVSICPRSQFYCHL